jgi:hypothetical protein
VCSPSQRMPPMPEPSRVNIVRRCVLILVALAACDSTGAPGTEIGTSVRMTGAPSRVAASASCADAAEVTVSARANIFGAGMVPPAPAGGGGGAPPVCIVLADGASSISVVRVTGSVTFSALGAPLVHPHRCTGGPEVTLLGGPEGMSGGCPGETAGGRIRPAGVVSGIASQDRSGYLIGTFLPDPASPNQRPSSLDFTEHYDFLRLRPALGQLYFIGDGRKHQTVLQQFVVPRGAARLYLGLADAWGFEGAPGFYDDNEGSFPAAPALPVTVRREPSNPVPNPGSRVGGIVAIEEVVAGQVFKGRRTSV